MSEFYRFFDKCGVYSGNSFFRNIFAFFFEYHSLRNTVAWSGFISAVKAGRRVCTCSNFW